VSLNAHWLLVVVETSKDWMRPIVKLFIVYYVSHFYSSVNITMTTTPYITINLRKRASGNTCDAVYFLDRTLQAIQGLTLGLVKVQRSHGSVVDILLLKGLGDLISGDGHSPPQTIDAV